MNDNPTNYDELINKLQQYRSILTEHGLLPIEDDRLLSNEQKISVFMSYFRFRSDVYAERYVKSDGKQGWGPACHNKFVRGVCKLGKGGNCGKCEHHKWKALTADVLKDHFQGKHRNVGIGGYPLIPETQCCYLLAIDFDDDYWFEDLKSVYSVSVSLGLCPVMERSASGLGGHLWIFFSEPVTAVKARKLGDILMQKAMLVNRNLSFSSFDRMFPSQDGVTSDGFGNLIAIPLRYQAFQNGNTAFINESGQVIEHQIEYLHSRNKTTLNQVEALIQSFEIHDFFFDSNQLRMSFGVEEKADKELTITESNELRIAKKGLNAVTVSIILRCASLYNQEYYRRQKNHMWIDRSTCPRIISYLEEDRNYYFIPRGCMDTLRRALPLTEFHIKKDLNEGLPIAVQFNGELRAQQDEALSQLLRHDIGVLKAYPSFGKTVTGIALIARLQISTLIIVPTTSLLKQWIQRLREFLIIPQMEDRRKSYIGRYSGTYKKLGYRIDVAVVDSLANIEDLNNLTEPYGLILVDECHHAASVTFSRVLRLIRAKYIYGLTATDHRRDGMDKVINMFCGNVRYTASAADARRNYRFQQILIPRYTTFRMLDIPNHLNDIYEVMIKDHVRNTLIVNDILNEYRQEGKIIVLSERIKHLELLGKMLEYSIDHVYILHGKVKLSERDRIIAEVRSKTSDENYILLATCPLLGEGFDLPSLKSLFLVMPLTGETRITQYTGRLHRNYEGKDTVKVYDYVDSDIPVLNAMYFKRLVTYRKEGYAVNRNSIEEQLDRILYPVKSFKELFKEDLNHCRSEVLFFQETVSVDGIRAIQKELLELTHRGIEISYVIPGHYANSTAEQYLSGTGGKVIYHEHHKHIVAIDRSVVWEAGFDILNQMEPNEILTRRIQEYQYVSELMGMVVHKDSSDFIKGLFQENNIQNAVNIDKKDIRK